MAARSYVILVVAVTSALCGACGTPESADPGSSIDPNAPVHVADLSTRVFAPTCTGTSCHNAIDRPAGLDLSSVAQICASLKDQFSCEFPTRRLTDPSAPNDSLLLRKLRCASSDCSADLGVVSPDCSVISDQRMPYLEMPLDASLVQLIERWIAGGLEGC
jgi:hypothetical protein